MSRAAVSSLEPGRATSALRLRYTTSALDALIPWVCAWGHAGIVVTRRRHLLSAFAVTGLDMEGRTAGEISQPVRLLERAMETLDERYVMTWTVMRRRTPVLPQGEFGHPASRDIHDCWRRACAARPGLSNRLYLSVCSVARGGRGGLFSDLFQQEMRRGGGFVPGLLRASGAALSVGGGLSRFQQDLNVRAERFATGLEQFRLAAPDIGLEPLEGSALYGFLNETASPATPPHPLFLPPAAHDLERLLGENDIEVGGDTLVFHGPAMVRHGALLTVKSWPATTSPGVLDAALHAPAELNLNFTCRFLDERSTLAHVRQLKNHNLLFSKSLLSRVREAMAPGQAVESGEDVNEERLHNIEQLREAAESVGAGTRYARVCTSVTVFGGEPRELRERVDAVYRVLQQRGFQVLRERIHLLSSWAATLPGQHEECLRWAMLSHANIADAAPFRTLWTGPATNAHLGRQSGREQPALTTLYTRNGAPYFFNFHEADLGHTLLLGPSGSGKSVFACFLISQYLKYDPNIFIFDCDHSCKITSILQGARHVSPGGDALPMNPVSLAGDAAHHPWLHSWLQMLLTSRAHQLTAEDDNRILEALRGTAQRAPSLWTLGTIASSLSSGALAAQLGRWLRGGEFGAWFDNPEDALELSRFVCFEMRKLLDQPVLARAFLEYLFYRIDRAIEGSRRPTLIYIEEAWFLLQNEHFVRQLNDWLRTLRKKNALVLLATQSIQELSESPLFHILLDNIKTRIFLANPNAAIHGDLYQGRCGLNEVQLEQVANAAPQTEYIIDKPGMFRVVEARFPEPILAYLRSDRAALQCFDRNRDGAAPHWQQDYLRDMRQPRRSVAG